jgi:hypothetical protein
MMPILLIITSLKRYGMTAGNWHKQLLLLMRTKHGKNFSKEFTLHLFARQILDR